MWPSTNIELEEHFFQTFPASAPLKEQRKDTVLPICPSCYSQAVRSMVVSGAQTAITGGGCSEHMMTLPRAGGFKDIRSMHFSLCVSPTQC